MPASIACRVASIDPTLPALPLQLGGMTFANCFNAGSGGDISLTVTSAGSTGMATPGPVQTPRLNRALRDVTQNPTKATSVNTVGVILADSFAPKPGVFGFMFDRGLTFDKSIFGRVPREGCAVFVGEIARQRPATFASEAAFTAVHELGHVFNLFHIEDGANFMASSPDLTSAATLQFTPRHRKLLALCSTHSEIHPGGTEFGELGKLDSGNDSSFRNAHSPSSPPLRLSIAMQQAEFHYFEPVELDVTLRAAAGRMTPVQVPDALDPGYETFRIWIEEPSGHRRLYRSSKHFCAPPGTIPIASGRPFHRDISVFGESCGYTFRRAGPHAIYVEMLLPGIGVVRSNQLMINVRAETERDAALEGAAATLRREDVAQLLFYRAGSSRSRAFRDLEKLAPSIRSTATAAAIHYALGRALVHGAPKRNPAPTLRAAREHLRRAADHRDQSAHRRRVAERLVEEIESR